MKSILKLWLVSAISLFLALPAFSADVTMRISLQLPLKSHLGQNLLVFKDQVESKSGGAIVVEIYDSAQLYKDKEVPAAVGSGSIEAGVASLTRYVGDIPAVDIFYQPFLFDTEAKVRKAVAKGSEIRGPIDEAIKGTGSTVLWWQAYGGAIMLSKGGAIKNPDDMKGKKSSSIWQNIRSVCRGNRWSAYANFWIGTVLGLSARYGRCRNDWCVWSEI
jgi:C4-dicarboxylate-binding protein DctP